MAQEGSFYQYKSIDKFSLFLTLKVMRLQSYFKTGVQLCAHLVRFLYHKYIFSPKAASETYFDRGTFLENAYLYYAIGSSGKLYVFDDQIKLKAGKLISVC